MLNLIYGTDQRNLADRLLEKLDEDPRDNLLAPEIFIVQNNGMGQWLSLYIAEQNGVAANLKFEFPSERIWSLIRLMDGDIPDQLPSDRQPMTWSVMEILQDEDFLSNFDSLSYYLQDEDREHREMRRWKLSTKIADVFDQYLIYRPELILKWEQGNLQKPGNKAEQWQAALWNRLIEHWKETCDGPWLHRAQLQQELLQQLATGSLNRKMLPERISVFGVSAMPPVFIDILAALSEHTDVYFYQLFTDTAKDGSSKSENPLLHSFGKTGSNFMQLLSRSTEKISCNFEKEYVPSAEEGHQRLLSNIRADIKQDTVPRNVNKATAKDSSVQVHCCHSPMREVEVLYDQLLALLDENPDLNSDDILVMTPDIETHAPMIKAVFQTPDDGQPAIPYSIADRGIQGSYPAIEAFIKILALCESRFKVTDVLDLFDFTSIQEAFDFKDEDLNRMENWIQDNKIKWGIDGLFKQKMGVPESNNFTWQSGLNSMMFGYAMHPDNNQLYEGIFPYDEIEHSDDADLLGRLFRLLHTLFKLNSFADQQRTAEEWCGKLLEIVATLFSDTENTHRQLSIIREAVNRLQKDSELGGYSREVPFSTIRLWLEQRLQNQTTGGGRIGRGVTFSSLNPMRSIPFKMIGMIGMNEGAFPRSKIPIEFDFMHLDSQIGDSSSTEEDRYLFLENILTAGDYLYFSFVGQSNRQDTQFPPSVVLKELLDYLEEYYELDTGQLIANHPLQAFSSAYFQNQELFTYSQKQRSICRRFLSEEGRANSKLFSDNLPAPDDDWKKLSVYELVSFFQHPAKFMLQKRLGIFPGRQDILTEDREPFRVNKLTEYNIGQELLKQFFKDHALERHFDVIAARNLLPVGWSGKEFYRRKVAEVQDFGYEIQQWLHEQQPADQEVDFDISGFRVIGTLSDIYPEVKVSYRFGKARAKDYIDWWIRHLLFQCIKDENHSGTSMLFTWDDGTFNEYRLPAVADAELILSDLFELYWLGLQQPLQLYGKSSYAYAKAILKDDKDEDKGISKAIKKWEPGWNDIPGVGDDFYYKLITEGIHPFDTKEFKIISKKIWKPFFDILNREGE